MFGWIFNIPNFDTSHLRCIQPNKTVIHNPKLFNQKNPKERKKKINMKNLMFQLHVVIFSPFKKKKLSLEETISCNSCSLVKNLPSYVGAHGLWSCDPRRLLASEACLKSRDNNKETKKWFENLPFLVISHHLYVIFCVVPFKKHVFQKPNTVFAPNKNTKNLQ